MLGETKNAYLVNKSGGGNSVDDSVVDKENVFEKVLMNDPVFRNFLLKKMLVFSCKD